MQIQEMPLSRIRPYADNPRRNDESVAKVAESLRVFGWRQPIVVDPEGLILVGHVRYAAALQLGFENAPVHVARDLSPEQARAYRLMDNRSHEDASWDRELLAAELAALEEADLALSLTGFEESELAQLLTFELFVGETDEDESPDLEVSRARSSPGDLFELGPHRVLCGDSTVRSDLARLMSDGPAQLAFTDPPYNVAVEGAAGRIKNDDLPAAEFREFLRRALRGLFACLEPGAAAYVCHGENEGLAFRRAFEGAGFLASATLIWVKDQFVMGRSDYQWRHEPILYGWRPGRKHRWFGGRAQSTVLEVARPKRNEVHPTMKPVALVSQLVLNSSREGDRVVDLFGGSGSTLIACHKHARVARLMELDPIYCDAIVQRWQAYTGERATRAGDGALFDELELRDVA